MDTSFNYCTEKDFKANLETVIDKKGFMYVISCLREIAEGKESHLRENWQVTNEAMQARQYRNLAATLDSFYSLLDKKPYNL